jgi:hypothetical protein
MMTRSRWEGEGEEEQHEQCLELWEGCEREAEEVAVWEAQ